MNCPLPYALPLFHIPRVSNLLEWSCVVVMEDDDGMDFGANAFERDKTVNRERIVDFIL